MSSLPVSSDVGEALLDAFAEQRNRLGLSKPKRRGECPRCGKRIPDGGEFPNPDVVHDANVVT